MLKNPANAAGLEALVPAARAYSSRDGAPVAYLCHHFTCLRAFRKPRSWRKSWNRSVWQGRGGSRHLRIERLFLSL